MKPHIRFSDGRWVWHRLVGRAATGPVSMARRVAATLFTDRLNQQAVSDKAIAALAAQLRRNVE